MNESRHSGDSNSHTAIEDQTFINKQTRYGIIFSLIWLAGFGSTYAFFCGVRSLKRIKGSEHRLYGKLRAWWCVIVGGLGMLFLLYFIGTFILYSMGFLGN